MPVKVLHDVMVTQVVCGRFHTICVTAQSQVGRGGRHVQGWWRGGSCCACLPTGAAEAVAGFVCWPAEFSVAGHTTLSQTQKHTQVFAWGHNSAGQLGLGDRRDRHSPTIVDALWALPVQQLAAGDAHSAALTSNGHMFIWGSNHFGQLGLVRDGDPASGRAVARKRCAWA